MPSRKGLIMCNNSIIEHMLNVLDQYEAKKLHARQVDAFMAQYAEALEGASPKTLSLVRQCCRLLMKFNEEALGNVSATVVLAELRAQVRRLQDGVSPEIEIDLPARAAGSRPNEKAGGIVARRPLEFDTR